MNGRYNYLLSVIILCIIGYLTLFYSSGNNEIGKIPHIDKVVHFLMFFGLSWAFSFDYTRIHIDRKHNDYRMILISLLPAVLFGGITEIIQGVYIEGRSGDIFDFFADILGAVSGTFIFLKLFKLPVTRFFSKRPEKE